MVKDMFKCDHFTRLSHIALDLPISSIPNLLVISYLSDFLSSKSKILY